MCKTRRDGGDDGKTRDREAVHPPGHACTPDRAHVHEHVGPDGTMIRHSHDHRHDDDPVGGGHGHDHERDHGDHHVAGHPPHDHPSRPRPAGRQADAGASRVLRVEREAQARNDVCAAANRLLFTASGCFAVNLMGAPGAGKTTLLERTLTDLKGRFPMAVIAGAPQSSLDAERIRATGIAATQVNTGNGCHLEALMVARAVGGLGLAAGSLLLIENVGNLVCPAAYDLGETRRVVMVSAAEGDDKPVKYPDIFARADLLVVAKTDLLPHVAFDVGRLLEYARRIRPGLEAIELSATAGQGLERWYAWIERGLAAVRRGQGAHGH